MAINCKLPHRPLLSATVRCHLLSRPRPQRNCLPSSAAVPPPPSLKPLQSKFYLCSYWQCIAYFGRLCRWECVPFNLFSAVRTRPTTMERSHILPLRPMPPTLPPTLMTSCCIIHLLPSMTVWSFIILFWTDECDRGQQGGFIFSVIPRCPPTP